MSYVLTAFRLPPGADPGAAYEALGESRAPSEEERAAMDRLADALEAVTAFERDDGETWVELVAGAFDVHLSAQEAEIAVPYGPRGEAALPLAARCAEVVRDVGGLAVWDPQRAAPFDAHALADGYRAGLAALRRLADDG